MIILVPCVQVCACQHHENTLKHQPHIKNKHNNNNTTMGIITNVFELSVSLLGL
jgi:hypothetical protein